MRYRRLVALLTALLASCGQSQSRPAHSSEALLQEVDSAMAGYLHAQAARDWSGMNSYYLDAPNFAALMNGKRQDLQSTRSSNVEYYGSLRAISGGFTDLRYVALGPEAVVVSGVRDQTMTDTTGVSVRHTGGASWVWVKRDGSWRIVQISSHFDQAAGQ
jgi:hypothetical protein